MTPRRARAPLPEHTAPALNNRARMPGRPAPIQSPHGASRALRTAPAWIMVVLLLAVGGWRIGSVLHRSFAAYPVAAAVSVTLFVLYAVPFVILLRVIDYLQRQPPLLKLTAFAWGGLVATSAAIAGGSALQDVLAKTVSPGYAAQWGPAVAAAGLEEILKVLGVLAVALVGRHAFTSIIDGFVYGALVGLGFQVVEDIVFAINAVALEGSADRVGPVLATFVLRGFIGGLWSHTLFSALAGAGVAYAVVHRDRPVVVRAAVAALLVAVAWGFHFLWNSPVLDDGFGYGPAGAIIAVLIKGIPALLVAAVLVAAAERREADYYAAVLAGLGDPRVASLDEISALVSPRRRFAARRRARARIGWAGGRAVRRLQRAQAQLAVALSRDPSRRPGPDVLRRRRDVYIRRHQLVALSLVGGRRLDRRMAAVATSAVVVGEALAVAAILAGVGFAIRLLGGS